MICGNSKILWTKKIHGKRECKWCHEKIIKPIVHIFKERNYIHDPNEIKNNENKENKDHDEMKNFKMIQKKLM